MFSKFSPFDLDLEPGITIHGIQAGTGPALLLLHGFPQTHHIWHRIADDLTSQYTVVALDLRGYGASSKPHGSDSHAEYSKSAMAADCVGVMRKLGHERFYICSHDRGARVAHKLCADYPGTVIKAILLDICPTLAMYEKTHRRFAQAYFHWFFLIQNAPIPETLIGLDSDVWCETFLGLGPRAVSSGVFDAEAVASYQLSMKDPATVHAMCEDYRAAATIDLEHAKEDITSNRQIQCPIQVLYGTRGIIGRFFDPVAEWKAVHATGEVECFPVESGHFIPEERPDVVRKHILEFLA